MHVSPQRGLWCLLLGATLGGCEAPLDLAGVDAQLARPTHRADFFQAIARHQNTVVTVGSMGAILRSADAGQSWRRHVLPGKPFMLDVTACPDGQFYAIEKTDGLWSLPAAGGWTRQALPEGTEPQAMTCDSSGVLWVTGGFSTIVHSRDAGASWESWSMDEDLYLTTIQFVDGQHGIATGEFGTVLLSADGGVSWERADDLPDSFYPQGAYFSSPATGWVVGLNGTIWATDDGGQGWLQMPTGTSIPLYGISGFGETLVAVGENTAILHHRVGDAGWTLLDSSVKSRTYLRGIIGIDESLFIAAGGGGVLFALTVPESGAPAGRVTPDE